MKSANCKVQFMVVDLLNWKNVSTTKYYNFIICIVMDFSYNLSITTIFIVYS